MCRVAKTPPQQLGRPFTTWSLSKLVEYLAEHKHIKISAESVRQILRAAGIRWQATKTWKASKDPEFTAKMTRVLGLYDDPPADGRVICVDEFGPLNLQPRPGRGWFPVARPARLRATFNRNGGVRHMFAALDLATGQMFYRFRDRKRWREFLGFLKQLRDRYPTGKLYGVTGASGEATRRLRLSTGRLVVRVTCVVCDNFSPRQEGRSPAGRRLVNGANG